MRPAVEPTWVTVLRRVTIGMSVVAILCSMLAHACGCGAPFTLAPSVDLGDAGELAPDVLAPPAADAGVDALAPAADVEVLRDAAAADGEVLADAPVDGEVLLVDAGVPDASARLCCRTQGAGDMNATYTPLAGPGSLGTSCEVLAFEGVVTPCP
jgi:hypothetical protein